MVLTSTRKLAASAVVFLMLLSGIFMWAGNPYLWLRVTAAHANSQNLSMGQVVFLLAAIAATGFVMVKVLAFLNGIHTRLRGGDDEVDLRFPWNQSLRDGRTSGRTTTVLDLIMVTSVILSMLAVVAWFFFFAGSTLHHGQKRDNLKNVDSATPVVRTVASAPARHGLPSGVVVRPRA